MSDPNWHWDGRQWLHWDGTQWVPHTGADETSGPATEQLPTPTEPTPTEPILGAPIGSAPTPGIPMPGGPIPPGRSPWTLILAIVAGVLALALIGAVIFIVLTRQQAATPGTGSPSPSPTTPSATATSPSPTPTPMPAPEYTTYYLATSQGQAWGAGVKTKGDQMSGWVGALQTDDLTCFNGVVSGGHLTGIQVTPPYGDSPGSKQQFSWPVSGTGTDLRLTRIGSLHPLQEVSLASLNQKAGMSPSDTWQRQFELCARLTGGLS